MGSKSEALTRGIRVNVQSVFVEEHSHPEEGLWFFAYQITIANQGQTTVQLLRRHWIITDGDGETQEVRGDGVVGEQPVLQPGESFTYASACPLGTPVGAMEGSYEFADESGAHFNVRIAPFGLGEPKVLQ